MTWAPGKSAFLLYCSHVVCSGNIPLAPLWRSSAYDAVRRNLASCRACLWNCHTELNLVMPQGATVNRRADAIAAGGSARR